jgi:predicted Fe-S protein YdhL (DUF1289 family)
MKGERNPTLRRKEMNRKTLSPCIQICRLANNVCIGCGRTADEIKRWTTMTESEKKKCAESAQERVGGLAFL